MEWPTQQSFIDRVQVLRYSGDELVLFLNSRRYVYNGVPANAIANQIDQWKKWQGWQKKKEAGRKAHILIKNLEPYRVKDVITKAKKREEPNLFDKNSKSFNLLKTSSKKPFQDGDRHYMGDVQRYLYDPYSVSIYITQVEQKSIHVSLTVSHLSIGTQVWQDFWRYKLEEESIARKTFEELHKICDEVYQEFLTNSIPNNLLFNYIRKGCENLDKEHRPKSRILAVQAARDISYEKDWRSNIYGKRYPMNETDGY